MKDPVSQQWLSAICQKSIAGHFVFSICGPSGVGKTTVVNKLSDFFSVYVETTDGNPYLEALLKRKADFNAAANQRWFLQCIGRHITQADPKLPLILDQDPAAIVLAYAKMFFEDGKIKQMQYESLLKRLLKIEKTLQDWKCPRTVLFLDASAETLYHRAVRRSGKSLTPPLEWFERVRTYFIQLFTCFPNAVNISTEIFSPEQVAARARALIERKIKDSQA